MTDLDFDTWIAEHRSVGDQNFKGTTREIHNALSDWCQSHRAWPRLGYGIVAGLWGFGEVPLFAEGADDHGHWFHLPDLVGPTGVPYPQLVEEYERDVADDYGDVTTITWPGGNGIRIVRHTFAMRVFAGVSPWAGEFVANTQDVMRLGFLNSGLADLLGMGDVIRAEGVPSLDEARGRANAGPLGGLTTGRP